MDMIRNAPGYVQWNIPLYDDDVFWVVPRNHRRPNTIEEHQHLLTQPQKPISGGIPVELKAVDGVVYSHIILHWGSTASDHSSWLLCFWQFCLSNCKPLLLATRLCSEIIP